MKLFVLTLLILTGCASDNAPSEADRKAEVLRRNRAPGVCGDAAVAQALASHKWCAQDRTPDDMHTYLFDSSTCTLLHTMTVFEGNQAEDVPRARTKKFKGTWHVDAASDRQLNMNLEEFPAMYHTVQLSEGPVLTLTGENFIPCDQPAQPEPTPEPTPVPETEI